MRRVVSSPDRRTVSHLLQVPVEKFNGSGPGCVVACFVVARAGKVHESVAGVGVSEEFVFFGVVGEFGVENFHVFGRWVLVCFAKVEHERAGNVGGSFERRRDVFTQGSHRVATVIGNGGFEAGNGGGHKIGYAAAHAKASDAEGVVIDSGVIVQESNGGFDVGDHLQVFEGAWTSRVIDAQAVVEVGRRGDIAIF